MSTNLLAVVTVLCCPKVVTEGGSQTLCAPTMSFVQPKCPCVAIKPCFAELQHSQSHQGQSHL